MLKLLFVQKAINKATALKFPSFCVMCDSEGKKVNFFPFKRKILIF